MYRIYTEDTNRKGIESILNKHVTGATLIPTRGCWHGKCEDALIIEIAGEPLAEVHAVARDIKRENHQETVLIVEVPEQSAIQYV